MGIVVNNEWKNLVATQALVCLAGCLEVKAGEVMVILMELQLAEACGCETILVESNTNVIRKNHTCLLPFSFLVLFYTDRYTDSI